MFNGLLRMLTPITPQLVEEAWDHRPEWMKAEEQIHPFQRTIDDSVIPAVRFPSDPNLLNDLSWLLNANTAIKTAQEEARAQKLIGSSLESSVLLELPASARDLFDRYADELEAIFVVSSVSLAETGLQPEAEWKYSSTFDVPGGQATAWVLPAEDHKCPRCWRFVAPAPEELCVRCEDVVKNV
jgi:isoleucyl-tRNA synthetase